MSNIAYTVTLSPNTTASATDVETKFTTISTWLNNRDNASDYWLNMKVSATVSNPAEIKSSAASCELDIDCTGSSGTPILTWRRSGTTYFTGGVDGAASNLFKFGTTALTTNVAWQVPSTGVQVQFAVGAVGTPAMSFIGDATTGFYRVTGSNVGYSAGGVLAFQFGANSILATTVGGTGAPSYSFLGETNTGWALASATNITLSLGGTVYFRLNTSELRPEIDNTLTCGDSAHRWTVVYATTGTINTSHSSFKTDIEDISDVRVPRGVFYKWKTPIPGIGDRSVMGYLADELPREAFDWNEDGSIDVSAVHGNAVIGELCAGYWKHETAIAKLEERMDRIVNP